MAWKSFEQLVRTWIIFKKSALVPDECEDVDKVFSYSVKFTGIGLISYLPEKKCQQLLGVITMCLQWRTWI